MGWLAVALGGAIALAAAAWVAFGPPAGVVEPEVPVDRYGLTPDRTVEIERWEQRAAPILQELFRLADVWVNTEVIRGRAQGVFGESGEDVRVEIWATDPQDERLLEVIRKLDSLRAGARAVPVIVHRVPHNRAELRDMEDAERAQRAGEDVTITSDLERGRIVIHQGGGPPPRDGWEAGEEIAAVWWVEQALDRRISIRVEAGGDPACSRFSHIEVTESPTAVEILAIVEISPHAASGGGCFMARGFERAVAELAAPLGDRVLTGCRLGLYPIDERVNCRQIVP